MSRSRIAFVVYLHGFASSPDSSKARRFARELEALGIGFSCPDFNEPAFETLTTTRMLDQTAAAIAAAGPGPVALIGSSLGAFVAVHAAVRERAKPAAHRKVDRLILLAPAFDFGGNRLRQFGEHGIDAWRRAGKIRMFHYGWNEERDINFSLYEDAARYDAFAAELDVPVLIVQGTRDASVDPAMVTRWADDRPNADLRLVDDEHQLTASIDDIWRWSAEFLGLAQRPGAR
jgi:pimeloyl-ACP methyl ester carboxylesterase